MDLYEALRGRASSSRLPGAASDNEQREALRTTSRRRSPRQRRPQPVLPVHGPRRLGLAVRPAHHDKTPLTPFFRDFLLDACSPTSCTSSTRSSSATTCSASRSNTLPDAPIVYTLHEYMPICHRNGQMVRTNGQRALHEEPRPAAATSAFPTSRPQRSSCESASSSRSCRWSTSSWRRATTSRERYVDWGIPAEQDRVETTELRGRAMRTGVDRGGPAAQPLRVLRPVHSVQGRRRPAARR